MNAAQTGTTRATLALCAALAAGVGILYAPALGFDFVNLDDPKYVYENPHVRAGLSWAGVAWAFTAFHASNWHPLTWLSHMLDVSLFGVDPGWHHLVNVALHAANTLLLFLFLHRTTASPLRSALTATLFGIHPLHVESVAWISERKDVLSTLFWLGALLVYAGYVNRPSPGRYAAVAALFALGLLCKPMVVTLPLTLLAIDVWPLQRWRPGDGPRGAWRLVQEKLPLAALSLAAALVTMLAQSRGGAISSVRTLSLGDRLANAVTSCGVYLRQALWPAGLAAFYPHPAWTPEGVSVTGAIVWGLALVAITAVVVWQLRRRPFLAAGWAWYLVTLVPVIGIVQVGSQARADRYTYVPLVGIFWAVGWAIPTLAPRIRLAAAALAATVVVAYGVAARAQLSNWRDTPTLFQHALTVTDHNAFAWRNLGTHYHSAGDLPRAIHAFQESLRIDPLVAENWLNLGAAYLAMGRASAAADALEKGARLAPADADAWTQLGLARLELHEPAPAAIAFQRAVALAPQQVTAWTGLAVSQTLLGNTGAATEARQRVRSLDPEVAREMDARLQHSSH